MENAPFQNEPITARMDVSFTATLFFRTQHKPIDPTNPSFSFSFSFPFAVCCPYRLTCTLELCRRCWVLGPTRAFTVTETRASAIMASLITALSFFFFWVLFFSALSPLSKRPSPPRETFRWKTSHLNLGERLHLPWLNALWGGVGGDVLFYSHCTSVVFCWPSGKDVFLTRGGPSVSSVMLSSCSINERGLSETSSQIDFFHLNLIETEKLRGYSDKYWFKQIFKWNCPCLWYYWHTLYYCFESYSLSKLSRNTCKACIKML